MRKILWASTLVALAGAPAVVSATEPEPGFLRRSRDVVQACFHRHGGSKCNPGLTSYSTCGDDDVQIGKWICDLESAPHSWHRKCAAEKLQRYNWREHPEIVAALLGAMQGDCDPCVRKKAADTLKDMKACEPDVIAAMQFSGGGDNSRWVRCQARCGVKRLNVCQPPCLTYVSSYGRPALNGGPPAFNGGRPAIDSTLEPPPVPVPSPRPILDDNAVEQTRMSQAPRSSVRGFVSAAVARVKSRW
jgi:hypothetical protein